MGTDGVHDGQELLFDAELRPHRSLSPKGFRILMAGIGVICLAVGLGFLLQSAWPILGFLGLDVAAIYLAFRISYRAGGLREVVQLSEQELAIRRIHPGGRWRRWSFQPYWLRVELAKIQGQTQLALRSHGESLTIGAFLTHDERKNLALTLRHELAVLMGCGPNPVSD